MTWFQRLWRSGVARTPAFDIDADEMHQLADLACESEEWLRALAWLDRAIGKAPGSVRLWSDRGFVLAELGEGERAFASYMTAAGIGGDGESLFFAGLMRLKQGRHEEAGELIARALHRSPEIVLDMEGDPDVADLRKHPAVRDAIRAAYQKL